MNEETFPEKSRAWTLHAKRISAFAVLVLATSIAGCDESTPTTGVPEVNQTQFLTPPADLLNYRYCEIIPVYRRGVTLTVEVYNTIELNTCPTDLWTALDREILIEAYGAIDVKLNGPRYWVVNAIQADAESATGKTVDFGGIEMQLRATLKTKLWQGAVGTKFYSENSVRRTTMYLFNSGSTVYELIDPEGNIYRMQSYTQLIDRNLTLEDLTALAERLDLPDGWSYRTKILRADSVLKADGVAYVINDDLGNSYQKILK